MTGFKSKKAAALDKLDDDDTQVYQRTWVRLTDEEISDIAINNPPMVHEFARAIEAKLREKNNV